MSLSAMDKAPGLPALRDARMGGEPLPVITLLDILRTVFRYKWPIASILTIAVLGALGYLMMTAPIYTAESKLLVRVGREKLTPFVVGTQPSNNFMFGERVENVNDQIEILRSPTIMAQVFPILKQRYLDILAAGQYRPEPVTLLDHIRYWTREAKNRAMAGYRWVKDMIHEPLYWLGLSQRLTEDELLFAGFQAALNVQFIKETNVVTLSFSAGEPNFAAFALNTFVDAYRREQVRVLSDTSGAVDFYTAQSMRTDAELRTVNDRIDMFLAESGATDPMAEKQLVLSLISGLERQRSDTEIEEQQIRYQLAAYQRQYDKTQDWLDTPGVAGVTLPTLADIDSRHGAMLVRRNALLQSRQTTSREVNDLDADLAALRLVKLRALQSYLGNKLVSGREEQAVIAARLAAQQARLQKLNVVTTRYVGMLDRRDQLLSQLKAYRSQIEQLGVNQALNERGFASVAVLNAAVAPSWPSGPRKGLILGLAAGFGVLFSIAYVIVAEFFNRSFTSERDVARVLGLKVVASVPQIRNGAQAGPGRRQ